jgi:hypothetical protein
VDVDFVGGDPSDPLQVTFARSTGTGELFKLGAGTVAPDLFGGTGNTAAAVFVQPDSDRPTVGAEHFYTYSRRADPAGGSSYVYDLEQPFDGVIPANLARTVTASQLAAIDARYDSQISDQKGYENRFSFLPWESGSTRGATMDVARPVHRTEYVEANPNITWSQQTHPDVNSSSGLGLDADHTYQPGQASTQHWWGQPTQPSVPRDEYRPGADFLVPSNREGNTLNFTVFPFGDSSPEHIMPIDFFPDAGIAERADYALWENGAKIAAGPVFLGNERIPVSAAPADYRFEYDVSRTAPWLPLSSRTITDWTFHSDPAHGTGTLPANWFCGLTFATGCGVIPLLFPHYELGWTRAGRPPREVR